LTCPEYHAHTISGRQKLVKNWAEIRQLLLWLIFPGNKGTEVVFRRGLMCK
jgi:hypothetical protein